MDNEINKGKLINDSIVFDYSTLPKYLIDSIKELEKYNEIGDWFNYDLKFDELEITAKSSLLHRQISESVYDTILKKYGGLYDKNL